MELEKVFKEYIGNVIKEIDEQSRTLTIVASTGNKDRVNESIPPEEWKLDNYAKNPVILWAHNYDTPPVAKALWTKADKTGLKQKIQFAKTDFAQDIFSLYKDGFLNAFSVGFRAKRDENDFLTFRDAELLEVSCVPVPCNAEALAERAASGLIKSKEALAFVKSFEVKEEDKLIEENDETIRFRIRDPKDFEEGSFRTINIGEDSGIKSVVGKLKGEDTLTIQNYMFEKSKGWTLEKAKEWVEAHKGDAVPEIKAEEVKVPEVKTQTEIDRELSIIALESEVATLKEGRVLSAKNRELIGKCVTALQELMTATDPNAGKSDKGLDKSEKKSIIIINDSNKDDVNAENLAKTIQAAIAGAGIKELIRGELKRMKGVVE